MLPCFSMMPSGCPQPSPQHTQVSQAIAMSGTEHVRATPRSMVLGQNGQPRFLTPYPKSRLPGGSVSPIEHGHILASTPCVHWQHLSPTTSQKKMQIEPKPIFGPPRSTQPSLGASHRYPAQPGGSPGVPSPAWGFQVAGVPV